VKLTELQKALVDRAINTECNLLRRLYPGDPRFEEQVAALEGARELIASLPATRQLYAPSRSRAIAELEAATGALFDPRYKPTDGRKRFA
jgi:beta-phosphoglucomutase-like phosphatase (HAD superfamily)